ncbi:hypothetical protein EB796_013869 [Bugula neritina]|uniref:DDB1- and CUL4-associated factor 15 WD40 repeat-containing domain-containing protein n=1 Tax=Bugula neritina TaxID=10212 RepID=A0A7J7JPA4_BUGNE|nr:hypothetical protein EB796_013869 [Bugula neritina]
MSVLTSVDQLNIAMAINRSQTNNKGQKENYFPACTNDDIMVKVACNNRKPKRCLNMLPRLLKQQITGLPLSRLKENRRCTARFLNSVVKPRRLREMVKAESHLCRRVFLGFLKGTYWLVSYRSGMDPLYTFEALENNIDMDTNTFSSQNSSGLVLEFWLYNSKRPLELKFVRNIFRDFDRSYEHFMEEQKINVYQWIEKPNHILVFGERIFVLDESSGEKSSILSITYMPVPSPVSPYNCPMCLKSKTLPTFGCVVHDCLLDFIGTVEGDHQTKAEKHLSIPNTMYLNISGQTLYCVSMSHSTANSLDMNTHSVRYGDHISNVRTTLYAGHTTGNALEVKGVSDPCDDFTMSCTTTERKYYLPMHPNNVLQSLSKEELSHVGFSLVIVNMNCEQFEILKTVHTNVGRYLHFE